MGTTRGPVGRFAAVFLGTIVVAYVLARLLAYGHVAWIVAGILLVPVTLLLVRFIGWGPAILTVVLFVGLVVSIRGFLLGSELGWISLLMMFPLLLTLLIVVRVMRRLMAPADIDGDRADEAEPPQAP